MGESFRNSEDGISRMQLLSLKFLLFISILLPAPSYQTVNSCISCGSSSGSKNKACEDGTTNSTMKCIAPANTACLASYTNGVWLRSCCLTAAACKTTHNDLAKTHIVSCNTNNCNRMDPRNSTPLPLAINIMLLPLATLITLFYNKQFTV